MKLLITLFGFLVVLHSNAQQFQAVHGSSLAGSLSLGSNPATMVNTPYSWDVNIFSVQANYSTNFFTVYKYSLISSPQNSEYIFNGGYNKRYGRLNFNLNILNARIALNRKQAIGFGINFRGYEKIKTGNYNFIDTLDQLRDFFKINENTGAMNAAVTASNWVEIFINYGRTIWDREASRLNAGIGFKVMKGVVGAVASVNNIKMERRSQTVPTRYALVTGNAAYGYSSNFDKWAKDKPTNNNIQDFIMNGQGGLAVDMGVEYLIRPQAINSFDEDDYYDYEWKIGLSLLDLGFNQYKYSNNSRVVTGLRNDIDAEALENKFDNWEGMDDFNDSLATVANIAGRAGIFKVLNPARIVLNADKYLVDDFYINGELSVNLSSLAPKDYYTVSNLSLITITPRWETKRWGVYIPIQFNAEKQLWIGGAVKAGPLLIGIHNWANVFLKNKIQNGGGYIALVLRSGAQIKTKGDRRNGCPDVF